MLVIWDMPAKRKSLLIIIAVLLLSATANAQTEKLIIYFDFDKSVITPEAAGKIDSLVQLVQSHNLSQLQIKGHCDKIGSNEYNDKLSERRANAVKDYLLNKGVNVAEIVKTEGFGELQPLNQNLDDQQRALNRRVEIWVEKAAAEKVVEEKKPQPTTTLTQQIKDTAVKEGSTLVLRNMNFEGGLHRLLPQSIPVLDELLQIMKDNPTLVIDIQGHICCVNDPDGYDYELGTRDLSVQRAKAIYDYLIEMGIASNRLSYRGFGSTKKIYPQETDEFQRTQNRRVEIKIVKK